MLDAFSTPQARIFIGTKADFIKLQAKHGVIGADSDAIRKAIEKIEKIQPKISEIREYVGPYAELTKAVKNFKSKYDKKHPKFLAAVQAEFVDPVEQVIDQGRDWIARVSTLPKYYLETLSPLGDLRQTLTSGPLDDASLKTAVDQLTAVGSCYNNATSNTKSIADQFDIDNLMKIARASEAKRGLVEVIGRALQAARKARDYSFDLKPILSAMDEIEQICKTLAAAVEKAKL